MPAAAAFSAISPGDVEVDRLDDDGVDALGDDVLRLGDLVLGVVLGRLDEDLVAGRLGGLGEERDVRVQVAEGGLLLEHERDLPGRAGTQSAAGSAVSGAVLRRCTLTLVASSASRPRRRRSCPEVVVDMRTSCLVPLFRGATCADRCRPMDATVVIAWHDLSDTVVQDGYAGLVGTAARIGSGPDNAALGATYGAMTTFQEERRRDNATLSPGPTLRDVAEVAGVSFKTVARVINGEPFVARTSARVNGAVRSLGYRRDHLASTLKRDWPRQQSDWSWRTSPTRSSRQSRGPWRTKPSRRATS